MQRQVNRNYRNGPVIHYSGGLRKEVVLLVKKSTKNGSGWYSNRPLRGRIERFVQDNWENGFDRLRHGIRFGQRCGCGGIGIGGGKLPPICVDCGREMKS